MKTYYTATVYCALYWEKEACKGLPMGAVSQLRALDMFEPLFSSKSTFRM